MKKSLFVPILAVALVMGACDEDEDGGPTGVGTTANVRLVNAVTGTTSPLVFTANGSVVGSAQTFGAVSTTCATVPSGSRTIAFGTANAGGTAISGNAFSTTTRNFAGGDNVTLIASGSATNPTLTVLNNNQFTGNLGATQAAVRFINLVPTTGGTATNVDVFTGTNTTASASALAFGTPSTFTTINAGTNTFTVRRAGGTTTLVDASGLTLSAGSANTVGVIPNATGTGFQLINIGRCS